MKSYHVVHIDGSVGNYWLVEDEKSCPIQEFYNKEIAKEVCDKLNAESVINFYNSGYADIKLKIDI